MFDLAGACWGCPGVKVPLGEGWSLRPVGTKSFLGQAACCGGIPLAWVPERSLRLSMGKGSARTGGGKYQGEELEMKE